MKSKTDIEIVTGFIGSGKTTFINFLIDETWISEERVLIIQWEQGNSLLNDKVKINGAIKTKVYSQDESITDQQLKYLINLYEPHRIIIEYNGTSDINALLEALESKSLRSLCQVTTIFHLADAVTFELFYDNMAPILMPTLSMSNLVIINNSEAITKETEARIRKRIKGTNSKGYIIPIQNITTMKKEVAEANLLEKGFAKKARLLLKKL